MYIVYCIGLSPLQTIEEAGLYGEKEKRERREKRGEREERREKEERNERERERESQELMFECN